MGKNKLRHYNEVATFKNVLQVNANEKENFLYKGKWAKDYFKNDHPIVLELACGKGEYTIGMATLFPDKNFIGIDVKGARIWRGAKTALEENKTNVAFLRILIEWLTDFFGENEISEIWITFADPYLNNSKDHKRLTSTKFFNLYRQLLVPGGLVNLKTDDDTLYQFTLDVLADKLNDIKYPLDIKNHFELIQHDNDIYKAGMSANPLLNIQTYYEGKHLAKGRKIKYVQARRIINEH